MTNHKAMPEQWENMKDCAADNFDDGYAACILELRAKVEALESNTKQWRIDHFKLANTCASMAPDRFQFFNSLLPDSDISKPCPNSSQIGSSLVERVRNVIASEYDPKDYCWDEARAVIREVAAWLREHYDGDLVAATVLERQAKR